MIKAICTLESTAPYSQSRAIRTEKKPRETSADYEERTWKERAHTTEDGYIQIPPMAFANSIKEAAKYSSMQIPGKGKSTYTKHFESGVMCIDDLVTDTHIDDIIKDTLHVPSDGVAGSGKRVWKNFPMIPAWSGEITYHITDPTITKDVFQQMLQVSGALIGIGRFRPRNRGYYGRFKIVNMEWIDDEA